MKTIHKNSRPQKQKSIKGQNRSKPLISIGTPQVSPNNVPRQQTHELLSDWEDAS